jgi:hypothetical protein
VRAAAIDAVTTHMHVFKGIEMLKSNVVKLAAVGAVFALVGCQDLKPIQADIAALKTQVGTLQSDVAAHRADKTDANAAAAAAAAAKKADTDAMAAAQAANGAQSTANQAMTTAQAAQASVDATNEKIDRMFKRSVSK